MGKAGLVWIVALGVFLMACGAGAAVAPVPVEHDRAYREYLQLIENFSGWAEDQWVEKDLSFNAKGAGVSWARGNGDVCIAYAMLLTELPDHPTFSPKRIPREVMLDHLKKTLRSLCLQNKNCTDPQASKTPIWGGPTWQAALETEHWVVAAWLVRDQLDEQTKALVRQVASAEANAACKPIPSGKLGDTAADDCCWNAGLLGVMSAFYSDDPNAAKWDEWGKRWALNIEAREPDRKSDRVVDGKPLSEWLVSTQVYPDFTLENHNFWDLPYQVCFAALNEPIVAYALAGNPVPESFHLHLQEEADILKWMVLADGDLLCPQGLDWAERDVQHSWAFTELGSLGDMPWARSAERRCLDLLIKRQAKFGDGALHANDFGYETDLINCWCYSLYMHKYFGKADADEKFDEPQGAKVFPHVDVAVDRTPDMVSSITWFRSRQAVMIVPNNLDALGEYPSFTAYRCRAKDKQMSGLGYVMLEGDKGLRAFKVNGEPRISNDRGALLVSFDRSLPNAATESIGYCALPTGEVAVFTRWKALKDIKIAQMVNHPFYWMAIPGYLPERAATENSGAWSIDGKLRMQVLGGAPAKQVNGGLIGSARTEPFAAKADEVFEDSVCVYQPEVPGRTTSSVSGDASHLAIGSWSISRDSNGHLAMSK